VNGLEGTYTRADHRSRKSNVKVTWLLLF